MPKPTSHTALRGWAGRWRVGVGGALASYAAVCLAPTAVDAQHRDRKVVGLHGLLLCDRVRGIPAERAIAGHLAAHSVVPAQTTRVSSSGTVVGTATTTKHITHAESVSPAHPQFARQGLALPLLLGGVCIGLCTPTTIVQR
eukprot:COSAG01_NODE_499_length_16240_cov_43.337092_12_plen_142_part_00